MKKFVFQSEIVKHYVPYDCGRGQCGVLNRVTGELTLMPNGAEEILPRVWAEHQCNKLNGQRSK